MGSGTSQLRCPKNYKQEDFTVICKLFDQLDTNGDFCIEGKEIQDVANVHVQNKIQTNQRLIEELQAKQQQMTKSCEKRLANTVRNLEIACQAKIVETTKTSAQNLQRDQTYLERQIIDLEHEQSTWQTASPQTKREMFVQLVSKDKHISFPEFFKYMKYRTEDIQKHFWVADSNVTIELDHWVLFLKRKHIGNLANWEYG